MEPITREEYYLAKIAGTYKGKTPEPVTIDEYYLATMAGDYSGNTPQPVTRLQYYMAKVAGVWGGSIPAPVTRLEYYWAAIASGEGKVFPPVTREEHFLVLVADAYSVVLTVVTGNPALLENSKGNRGLESLTLYGKSTQVSTTGAQLFDVSEVLTETVLDIETPVAGHAVGYWTSEYIPVKTGNYICSRKGTARGWTYDADKNGLRYINNSGGIPISIKEGEAFVRVSGKDTVDPQNFMFNEGDSIKPYEPYTGGKPSPSPEYPQEIKSAGQSGEIGVSVYGGNLFDAATALKTQIDAGFLYIKDSGEVVLNGTFDANNRNFYITLKPGVYRLTGGTIWHIIAPKDSVFDRTLTVDEETTFHCYISNGTYNQRVCNPMINVGSTALPYEPYKPAQTLIIPTPNGLPGVPTIDNGNYTDASGQQWLCDEVDLKRGVYVQNVAFAEFGKEITVLKKNNAVSNENFVAAYFFTLPPKRIKTRQTILSNCLSYVESINKVNKPYSISNEFDTEAMYVTIPTELYENDVQMLNLLAEKKIKILYATYPTERPLSTKELEKYRSLRTYSPTTTVINDAGAGMSVGYAKMK